MREGQKMDILCPECGTKGEVLWFPQNFSVTRMQGTTGSSGFGYSSRRREKVEGKCKECGYKFKPDDLD